MGLDMYLFKNKKVEGKSFQDMVDYENGLAILDTKLPIPKQFEEDFKNGVITMQGEHIHWFSVFTKVGYWRKANAVHDWFVRKVQDGEDDCGYYEVTKDMLEELLSDCQYVLGETNLVKGKVSVGKHLENGEWVNMYEDGEVVIDTSVAEEVLPTTSGFFFGSTDYNQFYIEDLQSTVEIVQRVLKETDFEKETISYSSSW